VQVTRTTIVIADWQTNKKNPALASLHKKQACPPALPGFTSQKQITYTYAKHEQFSGVLRHSSVSEIKSKSESATYFLYTFSKHHETKQLQRHKTQNPRYALSSFSLGHYIRGKQIPDARSPGHLNFVRWWLKPVGPQCGSGFMFTPRGHRILRWLLYFWKSVQPCFI